jgi:peptide deformylase
MVYPIYVYGMPVLRKKAGDIDSKFEGLDQLITDMYETLYQADGVGLAAPQIGKSIRVIVIDATHSDKEKELELKDFKTVLINPYIVEEEGTGWEFNEGCLSLPEIKEDVTRKPKIRLQYYDREFNFHDEYFNGTKARIIQHEVDHLNGVLFIDKISPLRRRLLNARLKNISKGNIELKYKMIFPKK